MRSEAQSGAVADAFHFEPVASHHLPVLADWLARPHIKEWWDDPETELGYIRDMIAGRDTTRPYIFSLDGEPVGYIQAWFVGDHQHPEWVERHPWLAVLPADAVGVDLSIGDANKLSNGIGSAALRAFVEKLMGEGRRTIVIDPDPANARAVRAYEKAGFVPVGKYRDEDGAILLMKFDTTRSGPYA